MMRLWPAVLLVTTACGQEPNATLASLVDLGNVGFNVDFGENERIGVALLLDGDIDPARGRYPNCALLDESFGGSVGGLRTLPSHGGNWDDERTCNEIGLTVIDDGPLLNQTVELHDRSLTISGTFEVTALGPRNAIHPTWELVPGSSTTFAWSHPPDLANTERVIVQFRTTTAGALTQFVVPTDNQIPVVVPPIPSGEVEVVFVLDQFEPVPALECINATRCTASFFPREYRRTARVQ